MNKQKDNFHITCLAFSNPKEWPRSWLRVFNESISPAHSQCYESFKGRHLVRFLALSFLFSRETIFLGAKRLFRIFLALLCLGEKNKERESVFFFAFREDRKSLF